VLASRAPQHHFLFEARDFQLCWARFEGAREKQRAIRIVDRMSGIVKRSDTGVVSLI
jgi:hypothetical protein